MLIVKPTLIGGGIGSIVAIVLYIGSLFIEMFNCACQAITCDSSAGISNPILESSSTFWFCAIGGAIVGFIYGLCKYLAAKNAEQDRLNAINSENARKQREKMASDIKQKNSTVISKCKSNADNIPSFISPNYKSKEQMENIIVELSNLSELQGKINGIVEDMNNAGGDLK